MARQDNKILALIGYSVTGDLGPWTFYRSKRGALVFFPRAPALNPPTHRQLVMRDHFKNAAFIWQTLTPTDRTAWMTLATRARLRVTGYNMFVYWRTTSDWSIIQTLMRQTGVTVQPG